MQNHFRPQQTFSGQDIQVIVFNTKQLAKMGGQLKDNALQDSLDSTAAANDAWIAEGRDLNLQHSEKIKDANNHLKAMDGGLDNDAVLNRTRQYNAAVRASNATLGKLEDRYLERHGLGSPSKKEGESPIFYKVGNLDSFSYSTFREKVAIRSLGRSQSLGYTKGARTIAGSMVFNVLQADLLLEFFQNDLLKGEGNPMMLDQIPPFNVVLVFRNEYGCQSVLHLFNVEIASESQRMSINDIVVQNTVNFYATDITPIQDVGNMFASPIGMHTMGNASQSLLAKLQESWKKQGQKIDSLVNIGQKGSKASEFLLRSRK